MPEKALVTGSAGFIGSHLCGRLLNAGYLVTGIDSFSDYYDVRIKQDNLSRVRDHENFTFVAASINDADLGTLLSGVDYVFHQAAQAGVRASWGTQFEEYIDSNVRATQRLCEAAKSKDIKKFIYASSSSVYGEVAELPMKESHPTRPVSPYGVTKLDGENLCVLYKRNFGLPAICLRYFTVFGPRQRPDMAFHRFLKGAILDTPVEIYGNGNQTRDFTYVADVVAANLLAMKYDGEATVFNIGGGSRVTVNHVLDVIAQYSTGNFDVRYQDREKGDVTHTFADTELAHVELGYSPKTGLEEGIEREADWLRSALRVLSDGESNGGE
jgi:UDP-glucose 4-epimerase